MADGGGGQHRPYRVIYSVQKKNLAVSEGGGLAGGGLEGFYCIAYKNTIINFNKANKVLGLIRRNFCKKWIKLHGYHGQSLWSPDHRLLKQSREIEENSEESNKTNT